MKEDIRRATHKKQLMKKETQTLQLVTAWINYKDVRRATNKEIQKKERDTHSS